MGFLAVGNYGGTTYGFNHLKAELFDFGSDEWTNVADYPDTRVVDYPLWICEYDMLYIPESAAYYVIGGADRSPSSAIVKFHNEVWSIAGQLNHPRKVSLAIIPKLLIQFQATSS